MASEPCEDGTVAESLPPEVTRWVNEQADRHGEPPETTCRRLIQAAHVFARDDVDAELATASDLEALESRLEAQREEFVDHVEDVRERVLQVKREADANAPADHDHEAYAERDAIAALESSLASIEAELEALESRTDEGFENFESVFEHVVDETETLTEQSATLARAILELRDWRATVVARERRRNATERLKRTANRHGIGNADCEACGASLEIALLTRPTCPHCEAAFVDVEPRSSIFGSHSLSVGEHPQLPGDDEPSEPDSALLDAATPDETESEPVLGETDGESGVSDDA
ncbi:hypothetical protein [Halovivax limisalsi]|uniref:hypothetical protein n=1 Tax=Halovivax limisalsi TaxID=1453760 RepID=UPI001FFC9FF3|nr:hypothetical protein [Halovivax limisalsi]